MTASALNIASIAPAAQPGGAAAGKAGAAAGPLAGFEALLGALFPQTDAAVVTPPIGAAAPATGAVVVDPLADGAKTDPDAVADATDATAQAPTTGDAAAALAASLMATQTAAAKIQITTAQDPNATKAVSRDTAKAMPLPTSFVLGENVVEGDAAAAAAAAMATPTETAPSTTSAQAAPAAPQARNTAPQAPAPQTNAPLNVATAAVAPAQADVAAVVAAADAQADVPAADPAATGAATDAATLAQAAPVATPPLRAAKSERAKATAETATGPSDDLKPTDAADKPVTATAVQSAAKAASAKVDAPEAGEVKPDEAKAEVETDSFDLVLPAETRAASQSATSATHTATGARGGPETVANLAAQIVKNVDGKATRFDVELNPHGLGKVDVRIEIGAQGRITAGMTFDNPQAAADVKARAAELQRALEQAGFDISGGISFDVAQDRGQQQQQNQAWQDQSDTGRAFQGRAFRAALDTAGDAAEAANQGALRLRRGANSGLDLRI